MGQYTVDAYSRLKAAFSQLVPDLSYVPGVIGNNILQTALVQKDNLLRKYSPDKGFKTGTAFRNGRGAINNTFDAIKFGKFSLQLDPLVSISYTKDMVITKVQGGTPVIEIVGQDLPAIKIQGIVWDKDGYYPASEVKALLREFRKDKIIDVTSYLFNVHGISNIYIRDIELPSLEGFMDTQPYIIEAYGYTPPELIIEDNPVE